MAGFDEDGYRKAAKAANIPDDVINGVIERERTVAAPVGSAPAPVASAPSTPQEVFASRKTAGLTPVQVVARNIGEAAAVPANAMNTASDAIVKFLGENPDLPADVIGLLGAGYGIKKARENFATLDEKMATSPTKVNAPAPVNTPSSWDIHNRVEPTMGTPSTNLTIDEAKARMTGVTPGVTPSPVLNEPVLGTPEIDRNIPAYQQKVQPFAGITPAGPSFVTAPAPSPAMAPAPVAPVTYVQPRQSFANVTPVTAPETPITSSAAPNSPATQAVTGLLTEEIKAAGVPETKVAGAAVPKTTVTPEGVKTGVAATPEQIATAEKTAKPKLTWPGLAEETGPLRWTANTLGTTKNIPGSQAAFEMAKDKLLELGVDLSPVDPTTGKKSGGGLVPEGRTALNNFYKTYTGEELPKGGKIETDQKMKLFESLKTHLEDASAKGQLKNLGRGALVAASILGISEAVKAAQGGNYGKLAELGFDLGLSAISAIPYIGTALTALTGTNAGAPTLFSDPLTKELDRPGVRQQLQSMLKTMSPSQFNVARDQYLSKISQFPEINAARVTKPIIGSSRPLNPNTLLPVPPPR
jgi:hypothetical protein